jgi:hypothetical protein
MKLTKIKLVRKSLTSGKRASLSLLLEGVGLAVRSLLSSLFFLFLASDLRLNRFIVVVVVVVERLGDGEGEKATRREEGPPLLNVVTGAAGDQQQGWPILSVRKGPGVCWR